MLRLFLVVLLWLGCLAAVYAADPLGPVWRFVLWMLLGVVLAILCVALSVSGWAP